MIWHDNEGVQPNSVFITHEFEAIQNEFVFSRLLRNNCCHLLNGGCEEIGV
jgi:hypothetical protein